MCRGSAPAREQVPDTPTETLSHFLNAVLIVTRRKYYHRTQRIALSAVMWFVLHGSGRGGLEA